MIACACLTCGWKGQRPKDKVTRRACPGCDGQVVSIADRQRAVEASLARATRDLRVVRERFIEAATAAREVPDETPLVVPRELRILEVSTGIVHIHRIPPHLQKGAKRRRRR